MFAAQLALAWLAGRYLAIFVGWFVLAPMYHSQSIRNGAPFQIGENARVLAGNYRDRVFRIAEVWSERGCVRLEIGATERERLEDFLAFVQIRREAPPYFFVGEGMKPIRELDTQP